MEGVASIVVQSASKDALRHGRRNAASLRRGINYAVFLTRARFSPENQDHHNFVVVSVVLNIRYLSINTKH